MTKDEIIKSDIFIYDIIIYKEIKDNALTVTELYL
jgi:hypothetical protein